MAGRSGTFQKCNNANLYPTVIGVDQYGLVLHIQYTLTGYIDPEILEEFTDVKMQGDCSVGLLLKLGQN